MKIFLLLLLCYLPLAGAQEQQLPAKTDQTDTSDVQANTDEKKPDEKSARYTSKVIVKAGSELELSSDI